MSEYAGIKAGAPHERTELSEYYCARCGCPVTDHDSYCRECGGAFQRSFATEPCDRDALLKLADEFEMAAEVAVTRRWRMSMGDDMAEALSDEYAENARRIREALGVQDG